jgi:hypothetical protein
MQIWIASGVKSAFGEWGWTKMDSQNEQLIKSSKYFSEKPQIRTPVSKADELFRANDTITGNLRVDLKINSAPFE